jgi:hypothetical protein
MSATPAQNGPKEAPEAAAAGARYVQAINPLGCSSAYENSGSFTNLTTVILQSDVAPRPGDATAQFCVRDAAFSRQHLVVASQ